MCLLTLAEAARLAVLNSTIDTTEVVGRVGAIRSTENVYRIEEEQQADSVLRRYLFHSPSARGEPSKVTWRTPRRNDLVED